MKIDFKFQSLLPKYFTCCKGEGDAYTNVSNVDEKRYFRAPRNNSERYHKSRHAFLIF